MGRRLLLAAIAFAASAAFVMPGEAAPRRASAPAHAADWTRTVVATPQGGFRIGNPNARVKLVEYGSIGCPHCAAFANEGGPALRANYVRGGKVSWEYRPFMIFPTDPGIFMLLRCQGATGFFPTSDRLYADQRVWEDKLRALPTERVQQIQAMDVKGRIFALTDAVGVAPYFKGLTPQRMKTCLADDASLKALLAISEQATKQGVTGTPAFFINGKLTSALDWAALEPLLKSAGG